MVMSRRSYTEYFHNGDHFHFNSEPELVTTTFLDFCSSFGRETLSISDAGVKSPFRYQKNSAWKETQGTNPNQGRYPIAFFHPSQDPQKTSECMLLFVAVY